MSSATLSARRRTATGALFVILGLLALVVAFSWRSTASAESSSTSPYPPPPACVVSTSSPGTPVIAGSTLTLIGSTFPRNVTVTLTLQPGAVLGSVTTDGAGTFTKQVSIPANITGPHTIQADAASSTCSFGPFSVGSGVEGVTAGGQTGSGVEGVTAGGQTSGIAGVTATRGLASTGFATVTASAIGLALLAGGAMFIIVGRRRKV